MLRVRVYKRWIPVQTGTEDIIKKIMSEGNEVAKASFSHPMI